MNLNPEINYPNIIVVGQSGSGKSTSIQNLDPEITQIINIERKPLPFKAWKNFKYHQFVQNFGEANTALAEFGWSSVLKISILESWNDYMADVYRHAREKHKGWDVANFFNKTYYDMLQMSKTFKGKIVVFFARDEVVNISLPEGGSQSIRKAKVHGKDIDSVESFFTICLYTDPIKNNLGTLDYRFRTQGDGVNGAKSPVGMFQDLFIKNDLQEVVEKVAMYYE